VGGGQLLTQVRSKFWASKDSSVGYGCDWAEAQIGRKIVSYIDACTTQYLFHMRQFIKIRAEKLA
jgi:hypothetical protein